jgi:large subunit ribosomal protein L31
MSSIKPTLASKHARVELTDIFYIFQMKKDIHPVLNPVSFVDVSTGKKFNTVSTASSKKTENIDGVDHHVLVRDITMDSHPAFTGEKRFVDTAGRVEKFQSKFSRKRS